MPMPMPMPMPVHQTELVSSRAPMPIQIRTICTCAQARPPCQQLLSFQTLSCHPMFRLYRCHSHRSRYDQQYQNSAIVMTRVGE